MLAHINDARADEGLRTLTLDAKLSRAAALHNQEMIDGCGLSHRCSGEAALHAVDVMMGVLKSGATGKFVARPFAGLPGETDWVALEAIRSA